jgi:hypothetical protein
MSPSLPRPAAVLAGCLLAAAAAAADPPAAVTRDDVYARATAARQELKSLRVDYTVDWKKLRDIPSLKDTPLDTTPAQVVFTVKGDRRMLRVTPRDPGRKSLPYLGYFDGKQSYRYTPGSLDVTEGKDSSSEAYEFYCTEVLQLPYRDADRAQWDNGLFFPHCLRPLPPGAVAEYRVRPATETVDGAACHVVEWKDRDALWVDPAIGYAYRRREYRKPHAGGSALVAGWELSDFRKVGTNLWLPHTCVRRDYPSVTNPPDELNRHFLELTLKVNRLEVNGVADADFDFPVAPGTMINSKDGAFQLKGDKGAVLSELAEQVKNGYRPPRRVTTFVVVNLVLLAAVAGGAVVWLRRSRRPAAAGDGRPA